MDDIEKPLIVCTLVAVISLILTTSTTASVYSTVEDDGWEEGDDDSQGEISSQEELEEADMFSYPGSCGNFSDKLATLIINVI